MIGLTDMLIQLASDENGVSTIEYAVLGSLIAVVCVVIVIALGDNLNGLFTSVCNTVSNAIAGAPAC